MLAPLLIAGASLADLAGAPRQRVGGDGGQNDRALDDRLIVRVDLEQVEAVADELEKENAQEVPIER
jgi:hypothetical protein